MEGLIFEVAIIVVLILMNGFFSGAEIAIISAKRSALEKLSKDGNISAGVVNRMKDDPDRFLATVQVGVTVVGTLASVIGGYTAASHLRPVFAAIPFGPLQEFSEFVALGVVVVVISYATLVIGELVPKSLALRYAERIACFSARPLNLLSQFSSFFIRILTASNKGVLKLLNVKEPDKRVFISEEEIKFFIQEGRETGIFEETEADLLHGVFEFADTTVRRSWSKHKFSAIEVNMPPEQSLYISRRDFPVPVYRRRLSA